MRDSSAIFLGVTIGFFVAILINKFYIMPSITDDSSLSTQNGGYGRDTSFCCGKLCARVSFYTPANGQPGWAEVRTNKAVFDKQSCERLLSADWVTDVDAEEGPGISPELGSGKWAKIYWHVSGDSMRVELMRMLEDYGTK